MRDYAELVKALRFAFEEQDCGECALAGTDRCTVGQTCRFKDAADAIEELQAAVPKWISVEDEPPKENDRYLVRYKRDVDLGDETVHEDEIRIMRFFTGEGWRYPLICSDHVRLLNEEVTHWMPLPAPPKEDAE